MKKIISLVVFIAALVWTWNIVHSTENIGLETHSGIQTKLADLIKDTLSQKKPNAKNLVIQRLWTEALTDNKVRAVFSFKFNDSAEGGEAIEQVIEGEAVLHREPSENSRVDQWTLQSVKTTNDFVTFTEGSLITPGPTSGEAQAPVAPAAPAQKNNETPRH
jgi:hypothetical protein